MIASLIGEGMQLVKSSYWDHTTCCVVVVSLTWPIARSNNTDLRSNWCYARKQKLQETNEWTQTFFLKQTEKWGNCS